ncbi:MAG: hypothetical protein ACRCSQ_08360, partial [Bacteroidales bacterium]
FVAAGKSGWTSLNGVNGYYLGSEASVGGTGGEFMPAYGYRSYTDGSLSNQGTGGRFWSSTASNITIGSSLIFNSSSVRPESYNDQAHGHSARCVRQ